MIKLKQMMKNKFDDDMGLAVRAAKIKGINQPQKLYKFASGETKEIDDLDALLEVIKFIFPNDYEEIFTEYCNDLEPNNQLIRDTLEYASLFEKEGMLNNLIDRISNSTNAKGKEWYNVYSLSLTADKLTLEKLEEKIDKLSVKSDEMKFLTSLLLLKAYINETEFKPAERELKTITRHFENIKKGYVKDSFEKRLNAARVSLALRQGDHKRTEELGKEALLNEIRCPLDVYVLMNMGNGYIMYDYEIAMNYFNEATKLANHFNDKDRLTQVKNSIDFCKTYWKKNSYNGQEINEEDYSDYNQAFYYISVGETEKAQKCLDSFEECKMDNLDKAFYYFYKGLITNERADYVKSATHFKHAGDNHYRKMPVIELEKLGEYDYIIESLLA
ncbi:AimR family lysis-lysogeny pheromone receptor [Priestia megaterium]|uniref:AimR family lysis-lysogeny pheromone receptor n=1 Tax=Priestia megaterium TaxID=1404 RepID=UPI003CC69A3C